MSARIMQPNGAGARLAISMTLTPINGPMRNSLSLSDNGICQRLRAMSSFMISLVPP